MIRLYRLFPEIVNELNKSWVKFIFGSLTDPSDSKALTIIFDWLVNLLKDDDMRVDTIAYQLSKIPDRLLPAILAVIRNASNLDLFWQAQLIVDDRKAFFKWLHTIRNIAHSNLESYSRRTLKNPLIVDVRRNRWKSYLPKVKQQPEYEDRMRNEAIALQLEEFFGPAISSAVCMEDEERLEELVAEIKQSLFRRGFIIAGDDTADMIDMAWRLGERTIQFLPIGNNKEALRVELVSKGINPNLIISKEETKSIPHTILSGSNINYADSSLFTIQEISSPKELIEITGNDPLVGWAAGAMQKGLAYALLCTDNVNNQQSYCVVDVGKFWRNRSWFGGDPGPALHLAQFLIENPVLDTPLERMAGPRPLITHLTKHLDIKIKENQYFVWTAGPIAPTTKESMLSIARLYPNDPGIPNFLEYLKYSYARRPSPHTRWLGARDHNELVAVIARSWEQGGLWAFVSGLVVDPDSTGHGLGSTMVLATARQAIELEGLVGITGIVDGSNAPALRVFRKLGFQEAPISSAVVNRNHLTLPPREEPRSTKAFA